MSDRRRYMGDNLPYDSEVEYLEVNEDSGYCCINTEYTPIGKDIDIYIDFIFNGFYNPTQANTTIYSNWESDTANYYSLQKHAITLDFALCHGSKTGIIIGSVTSFINNRTHIDIYGNSRKFKINNNIGNLTDYISPDSTKSIVIGGRTEINYPYFKLYSFRIDKADNTVLDLIPVRVGDEGFMFDKVSRRLLGNAGSGKFILGPDVGKPYDSKVEYLETNAKTGQAFIDTGYIPEGDDINMYATLNIMDANSSAQPFGTRLNNLQIYGVGWLGPSNLYIYNRHGYRGGINASFKGNVKMELTIKADGYIEFNYGDDVVTYQNNSNFSNIPNTNSMKIFNNIFSSRAYIKFYAFRLDKGGETILDLIPVRKDSKGYLYNKVDGKLYGNTNDGDDSYFIVGPDIN